MRIDLAQKMKINNAGKIAGSVSDKLKKVVILDAGHGGINPKTGEYVTPGKRSLVWADGSQYFEGVGNRDIVLRASQYLTNAGWKVLYTTPPRGWMDTSLLERVRHSNELYANNPTAFQISVHSNGFSKESANGYEVFTLRGASQKSKKLADTWIEEHRKEFPKLRNRGHKVANFAMNRVNCPSILVETMFHTNEKECKILMTDEGKDKCAKAISRTCVKFYDKHIAS